MVTRPTAGALRAEAKGFIWWGLGVAWVRLVKFNGWPRERDLGSALPTEMLWEWT